MKVNQSVIYSKYIALLLAGLPILQIGQFILNIELSHYYPIVLFLSSPFIYILMINKTSYSRIAVYWLILGLIIVLLIFLSSLFNDTLTHSAQHLFNLSTVMALGMIFCFYIDPKSAKFFLIILFLLSIITGIYIVRGAVLYSSNFRMGYDDIKSYLFIAMYANLGVVISLALLLFYKANRKILGVIFMLCLASVVFSLSRGALITLIIIPFLFFLIWTKRLGLSFLSRKTITFIGISVLLIIAATWLLPEYTTSRLLRLFFNEYGTVEVNLMDTRKNLWIEYFSDIVESPFLGYGAGYWYPNYPHNIFIQLWLDGGVFAAIAGLLFFTLPIIVMVYRLIFSERDDIWLPSAVLGAYLVFFIDYMKSHEIYTGITLFILAGLCMGLCNSYFSVKTRRRNLTKKNSTGLMQASV